MAVFVVVVHQILRRLCFRSRKNGRVGTRCPSIEVHVAKVGVYYQFTQFRTRSVTQGNGIVVEFLCKLYFEPYVRRAQLALVDDVEVASVGECLVRFNCFLQIFLQHVSPRERYIIVCFKFSSQLLNSGHVCFVSSLRIIKCGSRARESVVCIEELLEAERLQFSKRSCIFRYQFTLNEYGIPHHYLILNYRTNQFWEILFIHSTLILAIYGFVNKSVCAVPDWIDILPDSLIPTNVLHALIIQFPAKSTILGLINYIGIIVFVVEETVGKRARSLTHALVG